MIQNQSDQIKLQVQDTASLGLTKNDLQDSQKVSQMMIIGQRPFKVTCYFIECLKNFDQAGDAAFPWQLLYIEAYLHSIDTTLTMALTEKDLKQLVSMLRETTIHQSKGEVQIDTEDILRPTLSHKQIMNLALDVITF